jgi:hypothetical protein
MAASPITPADVSHGCRRRVLLQTIAGRDDADATALDP